MMPLERACHGLVQRLPLMDEEAFVTDLLREHVSEAVPGCGGLARRANETAVEQSGDGGRKIDLLADYGGQEYVLELASENGRDTNELPGLRFQIVEAGANHRLHRVG